MIELHIVEWMSDCHKASDRWVRPEDIRQIRASGPPPCKSLVLLDGADGRQWVRVIDSPQNILQAIQGAGQ